MQRFPRLYLLLSHVHWLLHILLLLVYTKSSQVIDDQKVVFCFIVFYYLTIHVLCVSCIYWECNLNILLLPPITSYVYTHFAIISKSNSCHTFPHIYRPIILTHGHGNHPWPQEIQQNGPKESWYTCALAQFTQEKSKSTVCHSPQTSHENLCPELSQGQQTKLHYLAFLPTGLFPLWNFLFVFGLGGVCVLGSVSLLGLFCFLTFFLIEKGVKRED